ncbi:MULTISPECIES: sigma-70 family RNA polymerase sigma factor [unclassified Ruegeria]|uniref:sigma-70 family RNA polymerase sigma factor n=1 Tax=unclassified Ruegeria TaxID=2625375 RepID=UPI0014897E1E|nr:MULTISPECIES: sigma-70 family RNA polymerase sigma factor [unclassified Ruegeria]NOD33094.1 sigma-70 family RNA polymerase sigma factor [Ruegeria sp. HKCCD7296]NOD48864.1 sigma-70 family RNA polymerase sigma factor [Ruegeria sp. HKCCD5849]NOD51833.1 sigma-70 family RNA polymerase sigma factor [Ruegeria sp. HKCCD5851]NOD63827.1 sigma-70 family RNA polymerase sigma factor [Ruegeria sp. HKCCD6109]NOD66491.1 sigma-70 family RNA polymerase sigma factor [Ruegeria sp. HKCCD7303]
MFTEINTATLDEPAADTAAPQPWRGKKRIKGRQVNGTKASCDTRTEWVEHVKRIRDAQDQSAFAELFQHFAPRIKAFLMKSGSDATMAEECAQEVMATLWHKAHLFDPTRATVATWVFTIARNKRIDVLRKQRRPEPEELGWGPEAEPDQDDVIALQQETAQLRTAMLALPEAQRELIEKAYFGDLSHREIASQTGLPLGTIKSRIRLALDRLRHAMN